MGGKYPFCIFLSRWWRFFSFQHSASELILVEDEMTDTEDNEEEDLGVMDDQRSVILHLISQLKLGMDLTRVWTLYLFYICSLLFSLLILLCVCVHSQFLWVCLAPVASEVFLFIKVCWSQTAMEQRWLLLGRLSHEVTTLDILEMEREGKKKEEKNPPRLLLIFFASLSE